MSLHAEDALPLMLLTSSDLPAVPEYTASAFASRVRHLLGNNVSDKTVRRWKRQTGIVEAYLTDHDAWMLAVYGRFMAIHKRPGPALKAADEFIKKMETEICQKNSPEN